MSEFFDNFKDKKELYFEGSNESIDKIICEGLNHLSEFNLLNRIVIDIKEKWDSENHPHSVYSIKMINLNLHSETYTILERFEGVPIFKEFLKKIRSDIGKDKWFKRHDVACILFQEKEMYNKAKSTIDTYASRYIKYLLTTDKVEMVAKNVYKFEC